HERLGTGSMALDPGIPVVALILPVAAVAAGDCAEVADQLDEPDVLGHLVAELSLDPQPQRCPVGYIERLAVHVVGDDRLRMHRILQSDAFVVLTGTLLAAFRRIAVEVVRAVEDHVPGSGAHAGRAEQQTQRYSAPAADRAP